MSDVLPGRPRVLNGGCHIPVVLPPRSGRLVTWHSGWQPHAPLVEGRPGADSASDLPVPGPGFGKVRVSLSGQTRDSANRDGH